MKLIDTHSHQYAEVFASDTEEATQRAKEVCSHVFLPNIDLDSIEPMLRLKESAPDFYHVMMGLHPCYVKDDWKKVLSEIEKKVSVGSWVGIGETGLDYYWDKTHIEEQKESLRIHIDWAKEMDLPLILHCRESMEDVIQLVSEGQDGRLKGIFHCFDGSDTQARKIIDLGFQIGIGGVVSYKKSSIKTVIPHIPLDSIVLETDSPYLPPVPYRGKRNESSYIQYVADAVVNLKELSITEVAETTSRNALRLFAMENTIEKA